MKIKHFDEKYPGWVQTSALCPSGYSTRAEAERTQSAVIENMKKTRGIQDIHVEIKTLSNDQFYVHNTSTYAVDR